MNRDIQHRLGIVLFFAMLAALSYVSYAALSEAFDENQRDADQFTITNRGN